MKRVVLLEEAALDLEEARAFYDRLERGVGDYCLESLLADLARLGSLHGFHARHFGCFRALAERFPFGVYYLDEVEEIRVIAVLDLRRNPSWIRSEINRRGASE